MFDAFFEEVDYTQFGNDKDVNKFGNQVMTNHEVIKEEPFNLYLIGVGDYAGYDGLTYQNVAPDRVREQLYQLVFPWKNLRIADLGNLKDNGKELNLQNLSAVISDLVSSKAVVILLGGTQHLASAQYEAYVKMGEMCHFVLADETIQLQDYAKNLNNHSYLTKVFLSEPNFLFSFNLLGFQSYFLHPRYVDTLEKLSFNSYRIGELRNDFREVEPLVRDADMFSFSLNSVKSSNALGVFKPTPNGFTTEEACALCRYAGLSDKLSSISFLEFFPDNDVDGQTSMLAAQMVWYFIEGYTQRKGDYPEKENMPNFLQFFVTNEELDLEMVFWKSKKSGRWWLQHAGEPADKFSRHTATPCSYHDYLKAAEGEIPERFFNARKRLGLD